MAHTPPAPGAIINALRRIVHERTAWDEPPALGCLFSEGPETVQFKEMPMPAAAWDQFGHPHALLVSFARLLATPRGLAEQKASDRLRSLTPDELCGIALRSEGWAPPPHMMEEIERRKQANGGKSGLDYSKLPGRIEVRQAVAVDARGRCYTAWQRRGDVRIESAVQGRDGRLDGRLITAMNNLLRALLMPPPVPNTFTGKPDA